MDKSWIALTVFLLELQTVLGIATVRCSLLSTNTTIVVRCRLSPSQPPTPPPTHQHVTRNPVDRNYFVSVRGKTLTIFKQSTVNRKDNPRLGL